MFPNLSDNLDLALALYGIDTDELIDAIAAEIGTAHFDAAENLELAAAYGLACSGRMTDFGLMTDPRSETAGFDHASGYSAESALSNASFDALQLA